MNEIIQIRTPYLVASNKHCREGEHASDGLRSGGLQEYGALVEFGEYRSDVRVEVGFLRHVCGREDELGCGC